jgi:hypothetical protein
VGSGLVGGLTFGWIEAIRFGWQYRPIMTPRIWADALSYSGLAHAVLWTLSGVVLLGVCATGVIVARWTRRAGALRTAAAILFVLLMVLFLLVRSLTKERFLLVLLLGKGLLHAWLAVMASYLIVAVVIGHWTARRTSGRFARGIRFFGWIAFCPTAALLLSCLTVQWFERPKLMEPTTRWKETRGSSEHSGSKPNIVLVVLDTQRVDRLGCYGYQRPTTPRLDAFAADALLYENCVSPSIWTVPSHASMFTGLLPSEHGANLGHTTLDGGFTTMAEFLQRIGYETIALSNNDWLDPWTGLTQGFDRVIFPMRLHEARGNEIDRLFDEVLYPLGSFGKWIGAVTTHDQGENSPISSSNAGSTGATATGRSFSSSTTSNRTHRTTRTCPIEGCSSDRKTWTPRTGRTASSGEARSASHCSSGTASPQPTCKCSATCMTRRRGRRMTTWES